MKYMLGVLLLLSAALLPLPGRADQKVSAMPDVGAVAAGDVVPLVRSGVNYTATGAAIAAYARGTIASNITATGTNQATGYAITLITTIFDTVAAGTGGTLPAWAANGTYTVLNRGANALLIYPASGEQIEALGANAAGTVTVGATVVFNADTTGVWRAR